MSTLQVKNLPDDLHAELVARARADHMTLSAFVTRALRREVARPSLDTWIAAIRDRDDGPRDIDSAAAIEAGRDAMQHDRRAG